MRFTRVILAAALLPALLLTSCITADQRNYVRYDAAKDEFHALMILRSIQTDGSSDQEFLAALYRNREHWIAPVSPDLGIFSLSFLRLGDHSVATINLFGKSPGEPEISDSVVPLSAIRIEPGTFFLQNGELCYYQAFSIPGKTLDALLVEASKSLQDTGLLDELDSEIKGRAGGGGTCTWDQVKAKWLKEIAVGAPKPSGVQAEITPLRALDGASLQHLRDTVAARSLRIVREKEQLRLELPLARNDSDALLGIRDACLKRVDEAVRNTPASSANGSELRSRRALQQLGGAIALASDDHGLTFSANLPELVRAAETALHPPAVPENRAGAGGVTENFLRGRGIPIDDTLTAEQILKDFNGGTLKSYPSAVPVRPGEGIVAQAGTR